MAQIIRSGFTLAFHEISANHFAGSWSSSGLLPHHSLPGWSSSHPHFLPLTWTTHIKFWNVQLFVILALIKLFYRLNHCLKCLFLHFLPEKFIFTGDPTAFFRKTSQLHPVHPSTHIPWSPSFPPLCYYGHLHIFLLLYYQIVL